MKFTFKNSGNTVLQYAQPSFAGCVDNSTCKIWLSILYIIIWFVNKHCKQKPAPLTSCTCAYLTLKNYEKLDKPLDMVWRNLISFTRDFCYREIFNPFVFFRGDALPSSFKISIFTQLIGVARPFIIWKCIAIYSIQYPSIVFAIL